MSIAQIEVESGLSLELVTPLDSQRIFDLVDANREHLQRFLPWVAGSKDVSATEAFTKAATEELAELENLQYMILVDGDLAGLIGAMIRYHGIYHIGYWIGANHEGKGIMTKCARRIAELCFEHLKAPKVEILCATDNAASNRVPQKLGFDLEGTIRKMEKLDEGLVDLNIYGKLNPAG